MALLIQADGTQKTVTPENADEGFTLKEVYKLIDCETVEMQGIGGNERTKTLLNDLGASEATMMLLDEEGKFNSEKGYNLIATDVWAATHDTNNFALQRTGDHIVGAVILCTEEEFK